VDWHGYVTATFDGLIKLFDNIVAGSVTTTSFFKDVGALKGSGKLGGISRSSNARKNLSFTVPRRTGESDDADVVRFIMPYPKGKAVDFPLPFDGLVLRDFSTDHVRADVRAKLEVRIPISPLMMKKQQECYNEGGLAVEVERALEMLTQEYMSFESLPLRSERSAKRNAAAASSQPVVVATAAPTYAPIVYSTEIVEVSSFAFSLPS
jgi:hypothetical protein